MIPLRHNYRVSGLGNCVMVRNIAPLSYNYNFGDCAIILGLTKFVRSRNFQIPWMESNP
jgi:hypothetical protein